MSDKFRKVFPLRVTFAGGEQPTSDKISALGTQTRNGLGLIEEAIGDIWGQSGDSLFGVADPANNKKLHIVNLGRVVGPASRLADDLDPINETIEFLDSGVWTKNTESLTMPADTVTGTQATALAVDGAGEFLYDSATGKVHSYTQLASGDTFTYSVPFGQLSNTAGVYKNLLPPVQQDGNFGGCKVIQHPSLASHFYLVLPPRLSATLDPMINSYSFGANNEATTSGEAKKYFWNETTALPLADSEHYRYALPDVLDYASIADGTRLPDGFLRLWNDNAGGIGVGRVMDGVVFYKPATGSGYEDYGFVLEIASTTYQTDIAALILADADPIAHSSGEYSTGLRVLTCGSSISEVIDNLRRELRAHRHDWPAQNSQSIGSRISHKQLVDLDPDSTNDPFIGDIRLLKSSWDSDNHLQYMHRAGSKEIYPGTGTSGVARDIYNGAMLGDLVMGSTTSGTSAPFHNNLDADSYKIKFGSATDADAPSLGGENGTLKMQGTVHADSLANLAEMAVSNMVAHAMPAGIYTGGSGIFFKVVAAPVSTNKYVWVARKNLGENAGGFETETMHSLNDGVTWANGASATGAIRDIAGNGAGDVLAVGLTTAGGQNWHINCNYNTGVGATSWGCTTIGGVTNGLIYTAAYGGGLWAMAGGYHNYPAVLYTAPDHSGAWSARSVTGCGGTYIERLCYGGGTWVAAQEGGGVWSYCDDITGGVFTAATQDACKSSLVGVVHGNGKFVAAYTNGGTGDSAFQVSKDAGRTWATNTVRIVDGGDLLGLTFSGTGLFIAWGYDGVIWTSPDGEVWTRRPLIGVATDLTWGSHDGSKFICGGGTEFTYHSLRYN
jgi:hypothetical protein